MKTFLFISLCVLSFDIWARGQVTPKGSRAKNWWQQTVSKLLPYSLLRQDGMAYRRAVKRLAELGVTKHYSVDDFAALHASGSGDRELMETFMQRGAAPPANLMVDAVRNSNGKLTEAMKLLNELNVDLNQAFLVAVELGYFKVTRQLFKWGANNYNDALCVAADKGNNRIILWLLQVADVSIDQALLTAAQAGHLHTVLMLINEGAGGVDAALSAAVEAGHIPIVEILFPQVDSITAPELLLLAALAQQNKMVEWLFNTHTPPLGEAFLAVVEAGDNEMAQLLISLGEGKQQVTASARKTAASIAVRKEYTEIVLILLTNDVIAGDILYLATLQGKMELVQQILAQDMYWKTQSQLPYLIYRGQKKMWMRGIDRGLLGAAEGGHYDIAELLIERGANNFDGALFAAAAAGKHKMVELLIEHDASNLNEALRVAAANGHVKVVDILLDHRIRKNLDESLRIASANGHIKVVELLLKRRGKTINLGKALYAAQQSNHRKIASLLRSTMRKNKSKH